MFLFSSWLSLAILNGFTSNGFNFLSRYILKGKDDATAYAWFTQLIRCVVFGIIAIFDWHLLLTPQSILMFVLLGLSEGISIYFYMKMHAASHLSISAILSRTRLIWVPILGFFILHEGLTIVDYIGIIIIFFGVSTTIAPNKIFMDKGALYANISAFTIAVNIILTKLALPFASNSVINIFITLPSVLIFPFLMKQPKERIINIVHHNFLLKLVAVGLNILGLGLFIAALRIGDASKVNAVYQGMMIFSVLAGIVFLHERENIARKLIGATVTVIGVVLLSFS